MQFSLITVSDSRFANRAIKDTASEAVQRLIVEKFGEKAEIVAKSIVPDNEHDIFKELEQSVLRNVNIILTIGGSGISPRDVTPEATARILDKTLPAMSAYMAMKSCEITKFATLSRCICGVAKQSLIINLPGSAKAATECFSIVADVIPHAIHLLVDDKLAVEILHNSLSRKSDEDKIDNKRETNGSCLDK